MMQLNEFELAVVDRSLDLARNGTVRRGSALLPWHGVGALDRNGAARVALAKDVAGNPDLTPVRLPGEATPFAYVPATMEPNFRKVFTGW